MMGSMPVLADPDRPEWRTLIDGAAEPLASFLAVERDGKRVADLLELDVPVERALPAILAELRGWRIAGDEVLGRALVAAGGIQARHAHVYSRELTGDRPEPRPPAGITLTPMDRPAADLLPSYLAAHPSTTSTGR